MTWEECSPPTLRSAFFLPPRQSRRVAEGSPFDLAMTLLATLAHASDTTEMPSELDAALATAPCCCRTLASQRPPRRSRPQPFMGFADASLSPRLRGVWPFIGLTRLAATGRPAGPRPLRCAAVQRSVHEDRRQRVHQPRRCRAGPRRGRRGHGRGLPARRLVDAVLRPRGDGASHRRDVEAHRRAAVRAAYVAGH